MPNEFPTQTMRIGGVTLEALAPPTGSAAETDSRAGKARVANEDFRKTRLFIEHYQANSSGISLCICCYFLALNTPFVKHRKTDVAKQI